MQPPKNPADYYFDEEYIGTAKEFLRTMFFTKSTRSGKREPLTFVPHIEHAFDNLLGVRRVSDGLRRFGNGLLFWGRKSAKTQAAAMIALVGLFLPTEISPEIYIAATAVKQADTCFRACVELIRSNPDLEKLCRIVPSRRTIYYGSGFLCVLSSKGKSQHSLNPTLVILDELHCWGPEHQELLDALTTASGARLEPLIIYITTAGTSKESICYREYKYAKEVVSGAVENENYYASIHEVPLEDDWHDEANWHKAMPGLGKFTRIEFIRKAYLEAKSRPDKENAFRRLYLNQWISAVTAWLPVEAWTACRGEMPWDQLANVEAYGGLDLGATRDLTSFCLVWPLDGKFYIKNWYWIPNAGLEEREGNDGVDYTSWARSGHITLTEGNQTDFHLVSKTVTQICSRYRVAAVAFDRAMANDTAQSLGQNGVPAIPVSQKMLDISPPTKRLEGLILDRQVVHPNDPITAWNFGCVTVLHDSNGNIKPVKPSRLASRMRIDGVVAMVMALGVYILQAKPESIWEIRARQRKEAELQNRALQ